MTNSNSNTGNSDGLDLVYLLTIVWRRRKMVISWLVLSFFMGIVLAIYLPRSYVAHATVFPVSAGSSGLSQYASLASLAGVELPIGTAGSADSGKSVAAILNSRLLVEKLVQDMDLVNVYTRTENWNSTVRTSEERFQDTVKSLRQNLAFTKDKETGVIGVSLELKDPQLAQAATNRLLELLDDLLVKKALTTSRKRSESLANQIRDQKTKVDFYQKEMAQFQKDTDLLDPKTQAGQAIEAYTAMIQQKMNLELQLSTAEASYSSDNPRVTLLENQIRNLDQQIQRVKTQVGGELPSLKAAPENLIRYQNLARDLEIATRIYSGLLASLEQAKLENDMDQVYIEVLDRALLPVETKPSRIIVFFVTIAIGILLSMIHVIVVEALPKLGRIAGKSDPDLG